MEVSATASKGMWIGESDSCNRGSHLRIGIETETVIIPPFNHGQPTPYCGRLGLYILAIP